MIWKECAIRRTYASRDPQRPEKLIGEALSRLNTRQLVCKFTKEELQSYIDYSFVPLHKLIQVLEDGTLCWNRRYHRQLILLSDWLGFYYIEQEIHAKTIEAWTSCPDIMFRWIQLLIHKMTESQKKKSTTGANKVISIPELPDRSDIMGQLSIFCDGSPKIRSLVRVIAELVILQKKVIIFCSLPAVQVLIYAVLQVLKVSCALYTSNLSTEQRHYQVQRFTKDPNDAMVFIASYFVGSTGLNLHHLCHHVILFDSAHNQGALEQALGRALRIGQTELVEVFEVNNTNSFQSKVIQNTVKKALAGTIAELDVDTNIKDTMEVTGIPVDDTEINIGKWYIIEGELVRAPDPRVELSGNTVLTPMELASFVIRTMRGRKVDVEDNWEEQLVDTSLIDV